MFRAGRLAKGTILAPQKIGNAARGAVLIAPKPGMPETLAGVLFWKHRSRKCCQGCDIWNRLSLQCRKCWQGYGFGATGTGNAARGTVLGAPQPGMPEMLAGVRFSKYRGWKCCLGYGFGSTEAGNARNAGRGLVLGPPGPEMLPRARF